MAVAVDEWPPNGLERVRACPACASPVRSLLYDNLTDDNAQCAPGRWTLWRCNGCATAYLDPRPTGSTISLAYRSYYTHDGLGHEELSRLGALVFATLSARGDANRLLDVGSGTGSLVLRARELGWMAEGVEPDGAAVLAAQARGAPTTQGTADALHIAQYDVITLNHVIEHVHEPTDVLGTCLRALRPGGSLWLAAPNVGSLGHRVLGTHWYGLDTPRHLTIFSEAGLGAALLSAGFARVEWRPSVGLREAGERVRRVVRHRRRVARVRRSEPRVDPEADLPSAAVPMGRRIAQHPATHAALRAAELLVPRTADELLVRAWPK
jgi:SAM-dependent methyltransferase